MTKTKVRDVLQSNDSTKEKLSYLWGYYKWSVILIILAIAFGMYTIFEFMNRPQIGFHVTVLSEEIFIDEEEEFNNELNSFLDLEDEPLDALGTFTPTGITSERFIAQWSAREYDVILLDQASFELYASEGTMIEFEVSSGADEQALTILDEYNYPMAIDASEFPLFEQYETTRSLYVTIPQNTDNLRQVREFFRMQGIEIEFVE